MDRSSFPALDEVASDAPAAVRRLATELIPLLYGDLHAVARRERRRVGAGDTLQTTALIHEAWLKLRNAAAFHDRGHFLHAAALAMRHILVNHARDRLAAKRGGGAAHVGLDEVEAPASPDDETVVDINDALERLTQLSPRLAQVVECRYFAGYGDEETALALGLTDRSVRRDWVKARAWLRRELGHEVAAGAG